jgi:nucleoside-diphosphate-sugar epimerase
MTNTYLVTGAMGCIGAWTLYHLVQRGAHAVSFDLSEDRQRLDLLMSQDAQAAITFIKGDLTDTQQVKSVFEQHGITHVIHLAALQVPFCRANPVLGAQVNVTGTVNIFEAARHSGVKHVAAASSIAVYGAPDIYPPGFIQHDAPFQPNTLYGVYKVANEGTARVYWQDYGISSTLLRPYTVYGLGRDQGLTSDPTKAMQAAAKGENFHINFGGKTQMHFASDMAQQFILAADEPLHGAFGFNLGGSPVALAEVARLIMENAPGVTITVGENALPFPEGFDDSALRQHFSTIYETPLAEGIRQTMAGFTK